MTKVKLMFIDGKAWEIDVKTVSYYLNVLPVKEEIIVYKGERYEVQNVKKEPSDLELIPKRDYFIVREKEPGNFTIKLEKL